MNKLVLFIVISVAATACGSDSPAISMNSPQEQAISKFVSNNLFHPESYSPQRIVKSNDFTKVEILRDLAGVIKKDAEEGLQESLRKSLIQDDTVAFDHTLARLVEAETKYRRFYTMKKGNRIGNYYYHTFSYEEDNKRIERTIKVLVFDSSNNVLTPVGEDTFWGRAQFK